MALILNGDTGITYPVATATGSATQASAGRVLQVVQGTLASQFSSSTSSMASTGLTASITPSSSSNKVLISISCTTVTAVNGQLVAWDIYRNSTAINGDATYGLAQFYVPSGQLQTNSAYVYLDSPATTSATSYTLYARNNGAGTFYIGSSSANSPKATIILMEISA